jgi:hypothetical protein
MKMAPGRRFENTPNNVFFVAYQIIRQPTIQVVSGAGFVL